jgi:hypothetical protein
MGKNRTSIEAISQWIDDASLSLASARYELIKSPDLTEADKDTYKLQIVGALATLTVLRLELNRRGAQ